MKYTIGIPAYKDKYLGECIESILKQTFSEFELIILNDCSPGNVGAIVNEYSDHRIRYHENENNVGGENVVDNWNRILDLSKGDYIVMMGDDDVLLPNYLEEFNKLIERYPTLSVFHCRTREIDENSKFRTILFNYPEFESIYDFMLNRLVRGRVTFISDFIYKVNDLRKKGGFYKLPFAWASDDITSFIAASERGIAHTNSSVFCYRRHMTSITSSGSIIIKLRAIQSEKKWYETFFISADPKDEDEKMVLEVLVKSLENIIFKRQLLAIGLVNRKEIIGAIFYIIWRRKELNVSLKCILYGLFMSLKQRENGRAL